jgi:hypothetical protein
MAASGRTFLILLALIGGILIVCVLGLYAYVSAQGSSIDRPLGLDSDETLDSTPYVTD